MTEIRRQTKMWWPLMKVEEEDSRNPAKMCSMPKGKLCVSTSQPESNLYVASVSQIRHIHEIRRKETMEDMCVMFKVLGRCAPQWMGEEYSEMSPPQKVSLAIVDSNTLNHQYCTVSRSRRMVEARRGAIDQKANEFELDAKFRARHEYISQQDLCRRIGGDACKSNVQKRN